MSIVGNIECKGPAEVFGRIEGEVRASDLQINDGAQVEGSVIAQNVTVCGRVKGTIRAVRFKAVLSRTVKACIAARIATGEVVHLDATLIRANVSWDAIVEAHADAVLTELDSTPCAIARGSYDQQNAADLPNGSGRLARKGRSSASGRAGLETANCGRHQTRRHSRRRSDHRGCS